MEAFKPPRVIAAWRKIGAVPVLDRNALNHPKVRHEAGGDAPKAAALEALEERHAANLAAAENAGLNAQVWRCESANSFPRGARAD